VCEEGANHEGGRTCPEMLCRNFTENFLVPMDKLISTIKRKRRTSASSGDSVGSPDDKKKAELQMTLSSKLSVLSYS